MAKEIDIKLKTTSDTSGARAVSASLKGLKKEAKSAFSYLGRELTTGAIWSVGAKLAAGFGNAVCKVVEGVRFAVLEAFKFESAIANFKTLTGSIEEAKRHVDELRQFAASNPLTFNDVSHASKTLLSFGIAVEEVMPSLKMLGDISLGDSEKFKHLALAFGQCRSAGRLMGQDLLQMINQGFNPLAVISQETGRSMAELKDIMSKGGISFEMVAAAFRKATEEGGLFHNALKNASETGDGMIAKMQDTWDATVRNVGEAFSATAKDGIAAVTDGLKRLNEDGTIESWADKSAQALDGLIKALSAAGSLIGNLYKYSGAKDVTNFGLGLVKGAGGALGGFIGTLAGGGSIGDAFKGADAQFMENFRTEMADGFYWQDTEYANWINSRRAGKKAVSSAKSASSGRSIADMFAETEEKVAAEKAAKEAEKAAKEAEKAAQKAENERLKALEKEERERIRIENAVAKERERLDRENHEKKIKQLRDEIALRNDIANGLQGVAASAQSEFDRAFAMYRDPGHAAAVVAEESDYQNDLRQLHKDANRYGGKWRIDELSRLMAAGDAQGVAGTLEGWRKIKGFTPQVEAMVRASAAERTKTTAEDELRKIEHNTANLAAKVEELLSMKG